MINLALLYAWCGEKDAAFKQLEESARLPVGISYGELKSSPDWDTLRGDPRFQKLLDPMSPKKP